MFVTLKGFAEADGQPGLLTYLQFPVEIPSALIDAEAVWSLNLNLSHPQGKPYLLCALPCRWGITQMPTIIRG